MKRKQILRSRVTPGLLAMNAKQIHPHPDDAPSDFDAWEGVSSGGLEAILRGCHGGRARIVKRHLADWASVQTFKVADRFRFLHNKNSDTRGQPLIVPSYRHAPFHQIHSQRTRKETERSESSGAPSLSNNDPSHPSQNTLSPRCNHQETKKGLARSRTHELRPIGWGVPTLAHLSRLETDFILQRQRVSPVIVELLAKHYDEEMGSCNLIVGGFLCQPKSCNEPDSVVEAYIWESTIRVRG